MPRKDIGVGGEIEFAGSIPLMAALFVATRLLMNRWVFSYTLNNQKTTCRFEKNRIFIVRTLV
jgi:hypothetical protein